MATRGAAESVDAHSSFFVLVVSRRRGDGRGREDVARGAQKTARARGGTKGACGIDRARASGVRRAMRARRADGNGREVTPAAVGEELTREEYARERERTND